jgi:hypothetical protein
MGMQHRRGRREPRRASRPLGDEPEAGDSARGERRSDTSPGRVEFDSRGNSIWRWENPEGDSTSILLRRLDNDQLQLEATRPVPVLGSGRSRGTPAGAAPARGSANAELELEETSACGGFDPYNNG